MLDVLPEFIDPLHFARQRVTLQGSIPLARMTRLLDSVQEIDKDVVIEWHFDIDEQKRPYIRGRVQAQLPMVCQRCLQPMDLPIDAPVALMLLESEEQADLCPEEYDPLILTSVPVSLVTLVEDELILALPIIVRHSECLSNEYLPLKNPVENREEVPTNPFQILKQLKLP